jgi:hypothetical protein
MARILVKDEWYHEISSTALYETEFETVVMQKADRLFPGFHFIPFKELVESEDGACKADFALVDVNYRIWFVGEVELAHHNLDAHVIPQVRRLARGAYGETHARALCQKCPVLNFERVLQMLKGLQPKVFVVVNLPVATWPERLRPFDAVVGVVQIFRSLTGYVLRYNGEAPTVDATVLTTCEVDRIFALWLVVHSPAALPIKAGSRVTIYYQGQASEWDRFDTGSKVYLQAARSHQLIRGKIYDIVQQSDGSLAIRPSDRKGSR